MIDRYLNIFFFFATLYVFLLFSEGAYQTRFLLGILLSLVFVVAAFVLNWLTIDGAAAATLFGIVALGFGGWTGAAITLAFFVSSSLISKDQFDDEGILTLTFRRDGIQVWANGFWFAFWLLIWFLSKEPVFMVAAVTSMAFSTADTWGSEMGGHRIKGKTWLISSFKKVEPGTDGGISVAGTLAALVGAAFITAIFWVMNPDYQWVSLLVVILGGFIGSMIDSLVGATIQGKPLQNWAKKLFAHRISYVDNNLTNWLSAGGASIIALLIILLTGH